MSNTLQIKRGTSKSNMPSLAEGEFGYAHGDNKVYIGDGTVETQLLMDSDFGGTGFLKRNGVEDYSVAVDSDIRDIIQGADLEMDSGKKIITQTLQAKDSTGIEFRTEAGDLAGVVDDDKNLNMEGNINLSETDAYKISGKDIVKINTTSESIVVGDTGADVTNYGITALGKDAGQGAGNNFAAQGYFAGRGAGSYFAAQGYLAGRGAGSKFAAQGYFAGREAGDRFTALGYESTNTYDLSTPTGINDSIAFGYQSDPRFDGHFLVKQANLNTDPLIQGDLNSGKIKIGESIATAAGDFTHFLEIGGDTEVNGDLSEQGNRVATRDWVENQGYITGVDWSDIGGDQSTIKLSNFDDDLDYASQTWVNDNYDNYDSWTLKKGSSTLQVESSTPLRIETGGSIQGQIYIDSNNNERVLELQGTDNDTYLDNLSGDGNSELKATLSDSTEITVDLSHSHSQLHSHSNKSVLDGLSQSDIDDWNDHIGDDETNPHKIGHHNLHENIYGSFYSNYNNCSGSIDHHPIEYLEECELYEIPLNGSIETKNCEYQPEQNGFVIGGDFENDALIEINYSVTCQILGHENPDGWVFFGLKPENASDVIPQSITSDSNIYESADDDKRPKHPNVSFQMELGSIQGELIRLYTYSNVGSGGLKIRDVHVTIKKIG